MKQGQRCTVMGVYGHFRKEDHMLKWGRTQ